MGTHKYSPIEPTAWLTAYLRSYSDIPYCAEIFSEMERIKSINIPPEMKKPNLAPQLEARYKLISKVLKKCGVDQILELASGLTPRGLNQTLKNESIKYVEIDLPEVVKMKKAIFILLPFVLIF